MCGINDDSLRYKYEELLKKVSSMNLNWDGSIEDIIALSDLVDEALSKDREYLSMTLQDFYHNLL